MDAARRIKLTIVESRCRSGLHTAGQEYIITEDRTICPPVCMELWHHAYPDIWALLNGAELDRGEEKCRCSEISCPDECRVRIKVEVI